MTRTVYSVGEALRLPEVRAADRCSDLSADRPPDRQNTVPALPAPPNTEDTPMTIDDRALADLIARLRGLMAKATPQPWVRANVANITTKLERTGPNSTSKQMAYGAMDDILCTEAVNALPTLLDRLEAFHAKPAMLSGGDAEALYDKIHLEELNKGGRMGAIRLRVVRRFNEEETRLAALQSPPPVVSGKAKMIEAADYLISLYERLWKGGVVCDLAEAKAAYANAKTTLEGVGQ